MSDYIAERTKIDEKVVHILDLEKFWDKMILAARVIVAIEDPSDVCVISARDHGKRAVIKYAKYTNASQLADRFTPGTFTNQIQDRVFMEPRLLILTDPLMDHQALKESSYVNIPVIALCNSDSNLQYVDVAIPCNNRSKGSIALVYWLLARTVRRMRGDLGATDEWEVPVDLFYHRDPEDLEDLPLEEEDKEWAEADVVLDPGMQQQMMAAAPTAGEAAGIPQPMMGDQEDWAMANETGDWADEQYASGWPQDAAAQQPQPTPGGPQAPMQQYAQQGMPGQQMYDPNAYAQQENMQQYAAQQLPQLETQQAFPEVDHEQW